MPRRPIYLPFAFLPPRLTLSFYRCDIDDWRVRDDEFTRAQRLGMPMRYACFHFAPVPSFERQVNGLKRRLIRWAFEHFTPLGASIARFRAPRPATLTPRPSCLPARLFTDDERVSAVRHARHKTSRAGPFKRCGRKPSRELFRSFC